nr:Uma2 family endonuclease [uncultured Dyadobacter sp.]
MNEALVSQVLAMPDAYLMLEKVKAALEREKTCRLKFYTDFDDHDKIEFINGEVIIQPQVDLQTSRASGNLLTLLGVYTIKHAREAFVGFRSTMVALTRNDYEPDICFFAEEKSRDFTDDQTLFPAPDLAIEVISDATEHRDRGVKFRDYQAHGVEEYWIVDPQKQTLEQYHLANGKYELILKAQTGDVKSFVVEGFQIPIRAIFDDNENLKAIQNL